jgi:hypothetical protein
MGMDDGEEVYVVLVVDEDEPEHTDEHPTCDDDECPCNAA